MKIGNREFQTKGHTYVMGILNVTPDSFSDGGKWNDRDRALRHVEEMLEEGADIIDIGGESTRPGYTLLPEHEEIERVVPVIEAVKAAFDVPVSLDTYKARVASAGIAAGADLINDVWGLKYDSWSRNGADAPGNGASGQGGSAMAQVIAESGLPCCLMHNKEKAEYEEFYQDMLRETEACVKIAREAGIPDNKIILDPGIGFGKTYEMNLETLHYMERFHTFGYPMLLGTSRKSVIGLTLNLPADQREEGTLVTTVMAVMKKYAFVRVHDVKANKRAIQMAEAILRTGTEESFSR